MGQRMRRSNALIEAGYSKQTVLEVIAGTALKVLSNYTTHIVNPPLDRAFEADGVESQIRRRGELNSSE